MGAVLLTVTVSEADPALPAASYAFMVTVCEALLKPTVFHENENGEIALEVDRVPST